MQRSDLTKWLGGGLLGVTAGLYLFLGMATALLMGLVAETSGEPGAWYANPAVCVFAWPVVWVAAYRFVVANG